MTTYRVTKLIRVERMVLLTILHIIVYAIVGLIPVLYNYYFIKDKVRKLRKFYLDKLRKHQEQACKILTEGSGRVNEGSTSPRQHSGGTFKTAIISPTYIYRQSSQIDNNVKDSKSIQPYTITLTSHVASPLGTTEKVNNASSHSPQQYVVVIIMDKNMIMNTPVISSIISNIPQVLLQMNKGQLGFVGSHENKA